MMDKQVVDQKVYTSAVLKNLKDFLTALVGTVKRDVYTVRVENTDTKLYKEIAENTRGVKGKLITIADEIFKKSVDLKPIETKLDGLLKKETSFTTGDTNVNVDNVRVSNLSEIKFPDVIIPKSVTVANLSEIKIPKPDKQEIVDISPLIEATRSLKTALKSINDYLPTLKPKEFPKIEIPKQISLKESKEMIASNEKGLKTISDDLLALSKVIKELEVGGVASEVTVKNFPPQHVPTPVTNININSLRGVPRATLVDVGTTPTPLPATPLEQRRTMIVFNNSGVTVYLGGSTVTTATGFPVLDQSTSPPIDAGQHMHVYAVAGSSECEVRVLEVSNDAEGN